MNKRKIQPVQFWRQNGASEATHIMLYNFHNYNFDGSDSVVSYKLGFEEVVGGPEETDVARWTSLYEGSVMLPNTVVQEWGEDDEPIFDYVMEVLNLTRDTE